MGAKKVTAEEGQEQECKAMLKHSWAVNLPFNSYTGKPLQSLAPNIQDQGQTTLMGHFYGMMKNSYRTLFRFERSSRILCLVVLVKALLDI